LENALKFIYRVNSYIGGVIMRKISSFIDPYRGLPVSIYVIFFASVVNNMGNFVFPFLTMFLTDKGGMSTAAVGIVVGINSVLGLIGTMIGGKLIDRIGRKKVLIIFRSASAIGFIFCAFIESPVIITSIIMLVGFLGGFSLPVFSTMTTDLTKGEQRKAAFSLEYMAINIGFSLGPLLAGFLYKNFIKWLFLGDAITTIISIILIAVFVPETMPTREQIQTSNTKAFEKAEEGSLLTALLNRPVLIMFSLIIVIFFMVFSQFNFGLSIQVGDVFKDNGSAVFGSLMTINAVICSLLTVFITAASQRINSSLSIAIGGLLYALGFGMIFFINSYFMFVISTVVWTLGEILVSTNTSVYIANHTPISHRGRFNSIFPIIRKLGFIAGPAISGFYIKYTSIKSLWIFVGILSLTGTILMYGLYIMDRKVVSAEVL
jgi:MFS family permease